MAATIEAAKGRAPVIAGIIVIPPAMRSAAAGASPAQQAAIRWRRRDWALWELARGGGVNSAARSSGATMTPAISPAALPARASCYCPFARAPLR
jgi:hypothetical protein